MAEKMIYGDTQLSTGPSSDLKKATQIAKAMVMQYGMSDKLGPRVYADNEEAIFLAQEIHDKKNYSEDRAELIDKEIDAILEARDRAKQTLIDKRKEMDALVKALLEKETVEQEEFVRIMEGKETLSE